MHELPMLFYISVLSQVAFTITVTILAWRSRRWHRMIWLATACCLPLLLNGALSMFAQTYTVRAAMRWAAGGATVLMLLSIFALYLASKKRSLQNESDFDRLTGLHNRNAMKVIATREVAIAKSSQTQLALLLLEVDNFTDLKAAFGEGVCNRALRAVSGMLQTVNGAQELVARLRAHEFGVLMPGGSAADALKTAEQIRDAIQALQFNVDGRVVSFTVSMGVGVLRPTDNGWAQMLSRADVALICGKGDGRNRVIVDAGPAERPAGLRSPSMPQHSRPTAAPVAVGMR